MPTTTDVPLRVAIVNDFDVVVRGVASLLADQETIEVVELAVDEPVTSDIDVALFDTFGNDLLTGNLLREVIANEHVGAVAAYTMRFNDRLRTWVMEQGARGYLTKSLPAPDLAAALRRIGDGEVVVVEPSHEDATPASGRWPGQEFGLTEREADTLTLLVKGMENEAIAEQLFVSPNTVKARLKSVYRKIDVGNRVQAALWAVAHGFEPDRHVRWSPD
jgi:NarL family two-component system response regulator LiaR